MITQDETQTPDSEHTAAASNQGADPQGPVPALCPPGGGHSPTRPSTSAVGVLEADGETEARPRNWYEAKQDAKRARLEAASRRAKAEADELSSRAHTMADVIPLGQPILVGHHSEKRDRGYRGRISRTFERAHEAGRKAQALAARAESVGTGGISSDDPEAVTKLKERLADLEAGQALMVAVNREIRKGGPGLQERLIALGLPAMTADRVVMPDFAGRVGVPDYKLKNNGAEIRRIRRRIDELLAAAQQPAREAIEGAGWRITEDRDENRVAVTFDAIPGQEVRDRLKASGFRWSPSRGAWVRQLNNAAWAAARYAMEVK